MTVLTDFDENQMHEALSKLGSEKIIKLEEVLLSVKDEMGDKQIIEQHNHKIWQGSNGRYYTYIDDDTKPSGRQIIAKSTLEKIHECIIENSKISISEVFEDWIANKLETNSICNNSADRYRNDFNAYIANSNLSKKEIQKINDEDIEEFINNLLKMGLTYKCFSNIRTVIYGIFKYAKKKKLTNISISTVVKDIEISKKCFKRVQHPKEECIFSDRERNAILDYCSENCSLQNLAISLTFRTGLRIGELAALKYSDIGANAIHIRRTEIKYKKDGKTVWDVRELPKTEAGDRLVILNENAKNDIEKTKMFDHSTDYIFEVNEHWMQSLYYDRAIRRICKALGIPERSLHKIRRTYGTTLINSDVEDSIILEQMGHTDINTTRRYYYYDNKDSDYKVSQINNAISF